MAYKLMVVTAIIITVIAIMGFAGTYINSSVSTDLHDNIDVSTDYGYRANQTMINMSKDFDGNVEAYMMIGWIMCVTLPLAAIVVFKKMF
jgi:hypothetical protein